MITKLLRHADVIHIWFYSKNRKPHYWTLRTWKQEPFFLEHLALSIRAESVRLDVVRSSSINHFLNVFSRDNWSNQLKDVRVILCIWKVLFQLCTKSRIGWFTSVQIEKILALRELSTNYFTTSMQFDVTFMLEKMKLTKTWLVLYLQQKICEICYISKRK